MKRKIRVSIFDKCFHTFKELKSENVVNDPATFMVYKTIRYLCLECNKPILERQDMEM